MLASKEKSSVWIRALIHKKYRIWETKYLSTDAVSSTDTKKILLITSGSLLYNLLIQKCKKKIVLKKNA